MHLPPGCITNVTDGEKSARGNLVQVKAYAMLQVFCKTKVKAAS